MADEQKEQDAMAALLQLPRNDLERAFEVAEMLEDTRQLDHMAVESLLMSQDDPTKLRKELARLYPYEGD